MVIINFNDATMVAWIQHCQDAREADKVLSGILRFTLGLKGNLITEATLRKRLQSLPVDGETTVNRSLTQAGVRTLLQVYHQKGGRRFPGIR